LEKIEYIYCGLFGLTFTTQGLEFAPSLPTTQTGYHSVRITFGTS
jgi:hypothetical protein